LRDPLDGCPWDVAQDFSSIVPSTLEECYELAEAIERGDFGHVAEELGDVLFQVVFYAQLGQEQGLFSFSSVVATLTEKLIRRHPHVFADGDIDGMSASPGSVAQVKASWEAIKQQERDAKSQSGVLADIPYALPALPRAQKVQKRAAQVNFDWSETEQVLARLEEEIIELREAMVNGSEQDVEEEVGDVLFSVVNVARHLNVDAETALRRSTRKFEFRFEQMEAEIGGSRDLMEGLSPVQWEALWQRAKRSGEGL
jgi:ATP diphosphatase